MKLELLLPGVGLFAVGFLTIFVLLALQGAMAKSRQFAAVGDLAAGRAGGGKRVAFFLGLAAIGIGALVTFAGVGAGDAARKKACEERCKDRGYERGKIRGSTEKDGGRHKFVACACEGGPDPDPLELDSRDLK